MRFIILLGCSMIAQAINPIMFGEIDTVMKWVVVLSIVMDISEWSARLLKK